MYPGNNLKIKIFRTKHLRFFLKIKKNINSDYYESNIIFGLGYFDSQTARRLSATERCWCVL